MANKEITVLRVTEDFDKLFDEVRVLNRVYVTRLAIDQGDAEEASITFEGEVMVRVTSNFQTSSAIMTFADRKSIAWYQATRTPDRKMWHVKRIRGSIPAEKITNLTLAE